MNIDIEKIIQADVSNRTNKTIREKYLREYYNNPNYCLYCGNIILVRENDNTSHTKNRKFCSTNCSKLYKQKNGIEHKSINKNFCINCGNELSTNRKYCSNTCQCEYEQKIWEEKWLAGQISGNKDTVWTQVSGRVRTYLFKKYNNKCARCGWSEINPYTGKIPLEVEHIDGNANNTTPENVTLLCPNCHSLTPTYRGANKGNGRPKTWIPKPVEVEI